MVMWLHLHEKFTDIDILVVEQQLVQFLLKQAGVDKRTGDLFGNRDLMNIARNMARGLKVCIEILCCYAIFFMMCVFNPKYICFLSFAAGC